MRIEEVGNLEYVSQALHQAGCAGQSSWVSRRWTTEPSRVTGSEGTSGRTLAAAWRTRTGQSRVTRSQANIMLPASTSSDEVSHAPGGSRGGCATGKSCKPSRQPTMAMNEAPRLIIGWNGRQTVDSVSGHGGMFDMSRCLVFGLPHPVPIAPGKFQHAFIRPFFEWRITRMPRLLIGIVVLGVIAANQCPARVGAFVLI